MPARTAFRFGETDRHRRQKLSRHRHCEEPVLSAGLLRFGASLAITRWISQSLAPAPGFNVSDLWSAGDVGWPGWIWCAVAARADI
jgi:hypothetical protein